MNARRHAAVATLALAVLTGHVTSRISQQPLASVRVVATGPTKTSATTDAGGLYRLRNLKPGRYILTLSSDDVPPVQRNVTIGTHGTQTLDITVCSTTLDYNCGSF